MFVLERHITDNILVAYEIVNYLERQTKVKHGRMSIKLDVSKAYDRVECDCLDTILVTFEFPQQLINLIMHCVKYVTFLVLINGESRCPITPSRGLR